MSHHTISEDAIRMDWRDRITSDPEILLGKPVVKGTRISVELILGWLANGWTFDTIVEAYPHITREDILAALGLRGGDVARRTVHRQIQSLCVKPALIVNENFPFPALRKLREQPSPPDKSAAWVLALLDDPAQAIGQLAVIVERTISRRPMTSAAS